MGQKMRLKPSKKELNWRWNFAMQKICGGNRLARWTLLLLGCISISAAC
jgi:hypothetical protein